MKTFASYLRIIVFAAVAFILFEVTIDSGAEWAFQKHPVILAVIAILVIFAMAIEIVVETMKSILYKSLSTEAKERFIAEEDKNKTTNNYFGLKGVYDKLKGGRPMQEEGEIILDHNYDGIRELDNNLPPWWVYMFYATIIFGVVYFAKYEIFDGQSTAQEYEAEVVQANLDHIEYLKTAKNLVDASTVVALTDKADLDAGKNIYETNCAVCHKPDGGGGIGPNLTDAYWILGGGIKNVFNTISEGGRDGKGMVPWKKEISPLEMSQVASYVLGFQGTTPEAPKDAEGEIWNDPDAVDTKETPSENNEVITEETEEVQE